MTTPEGKVKDKIKRYMKKILEGIWSYMPVQTGYGQHGIPDHIYCVPVVITQEMVGDTIGLFVGIEAKTTRGRMSDHQIMQRDGIIAAGGIYATIYGSDEIENKLCHLRRLQ